MPWQRPGLNSNELAYVLAYLSLKSSSARALLDQLDEDGLFGAKTIEIDGRLVSRDLLDSVREIDFLKTHAGLDASTLSVLDIGAGDGYYVQRLSERVGPTGLVFGEDIELRYLELLRARVERAGWPNVRVIEGTEDDPALPPASIDVAIMIHMYHEITSPFALLHRLTPALREGGRLAVHTDVGDVSPRPDQTGGQLKRRGNADRFDGDIGA